MSDTGQAKVAGWPSLSFVIPVLNEAKDLPEFLTALQPWRPVAELLLVDGGSTDGSPDIARPWVDRVLVASRGRARQMNTGAEAASAPYLFFLHSDTLPRIAPDALLEVLEERPVWGFFRVRLSGAAPLLRLVEAFMNWRSQISSVATGDQCLFLSREAWRASGGFPDVALMEDVALSKRLRSLAKPRVITEPVITSSRRWEDRGIIRTVLLMWYLRLRYWLGADPGVLAKIYRG